jgi:hypothetical protein
MSNKYKLRSIIIADDIRQEVNGKEIFIGVYNFSMIFPAFPAFVPKIIIKLIMDMLDDNAKTFLMSLKDPNGTELSKFSGELPVSLNKTEPIGLGFILGSLQFYAEGRYTIEFGVEGEATETITDFYVRVPRDAVERSRVQLAN